MLASVLGLQAPVRRKGTLGPVATQSPCSVEAEEASLSVSSLHQITNSSCAGGAGPQRHPFATGTSLSPVAQQPPGETGVTAVLISQSPCFHCVSLSAWEPDPPAQSSASSLSHTWAGVDARFLPGWQFEWPRWCQVGAQWWRLSPGQGAGVAQTARLSRPFSWPPAGDERWFPTWDRRVLRPRLCHHQALAEVTRLCTLSSALCPCPQAVPNLNNCTTSPSDICIKTGCTEQLALH